MLYMNKQMTLEQANSLRARVGLPPITQAQFDRMVANSKTRAAKRAYRG